MVNGAFSIEKKNNGEVFLVLTVKGKEEVNELALDMIAAGFDARYEPGNRNGRYASCLICNERTSIKIDACAE